MTDDLAWETVDSRTSYTCEGFDILTDTVRFPSGEEAEFDYLTEGESVVVLPFTPDGDVVAIEQWRQPVGRVNLALPAGGIEDDDADPEACVARELEEETGYLPGEVEHLTTVEPANGFSDAVFHYFVARDCEPGGQQDLDFNESIRVDTTTLDELLDAARTDDLRDGRTALGVLYYSAFA
jgi:ADP-ribose pyrophosphatase